MEVDTPRTLGMGMCGGGGGGDILEGYRDKIRRGVTFSERSKSGDFRFDGSSRGAGSGREFSDMPAFGLKRRDVVGYPERGITDLDVGRRRQQDMSEKSYRLPRIVVRDGIGRQLDTFTTLQEAIYRAKWNVRSTCESHTPREWRLPKAPLPSRPDYSRQGAKLPSKPHELHNTPRATRPVLPGSVVVS